VCSFCISASSNPFLRGISLPVSDFEVHVFVYFQQYKKRAKAKGKKIFFLLSITGDNNNHPFCANAFQPLSK
jgi:hypothetical protein